MAGTTPGPEDEARAAGRLVADALTGLTRAVQASHRDLSGAVDRIVADGAHTWRPLSATSTAGVYGVVTAANRLAPRAVTEFVAVTGWAQVLAPSQTRRGRAVLAAVNGLWSPLVEANPELSITMAVRVAHSDVALDADSVAAAFPGATGDLVVFVHGLAQDEDSWKRPAAGQGDGYGARLCADHGMTPVYVRYSTGRRVHHNGRDLADLLDALASSWPVRVRAITLVAHSMGGLVAVAAVQQALERQSVWADLLRLVVTLGTPYHGSPMARALRDVNEALARTPVLGPLIEWIRVRTDGGGDLCSVTPLTVKPLTVNPLTAASSADGAPTTPRIPAVTAVSASLGGAADHRLGRLVGDGLVPVASAQAGDVTDLAVDTIHVNRAGHFDLLNHPAVYEHISMMVAGSAAP